MAINFKNIIENANKKKQDNQEALQRLEANKKINTSDLKSEREGGQKQVSSTCLKTVEYNPKNDSLTVQFRNGKKNNKYWYPNVTPDIVTGLLKAPSKGKFFWRNIHDPLTLNPGHNPSVNAQRNASKKDNYAKKEKQYNRLRRFNKSFVPTFKD